MELRKFQDVDFKGKKVFLRLDLNVPMDGGLITDDTRIRAALPTLRKILEQTNKVVICSHLGRPKGTPDPKYSLETVGERLAELLGQEVVFVDDYEDENWADILDHLESGQLALLENLRFFAGETANSRDFSLNLIRGFDYYVDDAFGAVHRAHASTVGAPLELNPEQRLAGYLIQREVAALAPLLKRPEAPFTVIMGGAKVSDKIKVILSLLDHCNNLLIGGAMAYSFLKYKGKAVGNSKIDAGQDELLNSIFRNAERRAVNIVLPEDHICAATFTANAQAVTIDSADIPSGLMGLDIGPKTLERYRSIICESKTVLWNGPMGVFEWEQFSSGSLGVAHAMAQNNGFTIIGGGDSVAAAVKAGVTDRIKHISTGGGASLEFLEGSILPGIKVLLK